MEARIGGEAGHLVARQGVTREQANDMVKQILARYEAQMNEAPIGKRFDECYDLDTLQPTQEYLDLYERVKEELVRLGQFQLCRSSTPTHQWLNYSLL